MSPKSINLALVIPPPVPSEPSAMGLPRGASVEDYYASWVAQQLSETRGLLNGVRLASGLPVMDGSEWANEVHKFETMLAGLPGDSAAHALRALKRHRSFSCPIQPENINP